MKIFFYTEKGEEITFIDNLTSNPFKVGDRIRLVVDCLSSKDMADENLKVYQEELDKFSQKYATIIREEKSLRFNAAKEAEVEIDFFCHINK